MILGIDLDNTLICYDGLFYSAAVGHGFIKEVKGPKDKRSVRDYFCTQDREDDFTILQGYVYGPGLKDAKVYPGALDCLKVLKNSGVKVYIISHKTEKPYRGPVYDLRQAARDWLEENGFHRNDLIDRDDVFLENTLEDKINRIKIQKCTHFIDDMDRFFQHPLFPEEVKRILFHPPNEDGVSDYQCNFDSVQSWKAVQELLGVVNGK